MSIPKIILFVFIVIVFISAGVYYNNWQDAQLQLQQQQEAARIQKVQDDIVAKLVKKDVVVGTGAEAKAGDTISAHYLGTFTDGKKFDSSYDRGVPITFVLGAGQVIKGWDLGLIGMKVGGKRMLTIPPELAYGPQANGPVPANSTLNFTVELVNVSSTQQ